MMYSYCTNCALCACVVLRSVRTLRLRHLQKLMVGVADIHFLFRMISILEGSLLCCSDEQALRLAALFSLSMPTFQYVCSRVVVIVVFRSINTFAKRGFVVACDD